MRGGNVKAARILASYFLGSLAVCLGVVFFFNSQGFHGFVPNIPKETILSLRIAFAGLALFLLFPLVWLLSRRGNNLNQTRWISYTITAFAMAELPMILGLILFLTKGAYKTFFAFFAVTAFYLFIAWPREG